MPEPIYKGVPLHNDALMAACDAFHEDVGEVPNVDAEFLLRLMRAIATYKIKEAEELASDKPLN